MKNHIATYWEQSPPLKGKGKVGSLSWSNSISEHRFNTVPYWKDYLSADAYYKKRILEVGCGAGSDLLEYAKMGNLCYGVDITKKAISITKKRFAVEDRKAELITQYNGHTLPFAAESMDMVCSYGVLHHTPNMDHLFSEIYRVLIPGGTFRCMLYHKDSLLYNYSILYRAYSEFEVAKAANHPAMTALWSEFRTGCPYTQVFSRADIEERLSFFGHVKTWCDHYVYDDYNTGERKKPGLEFENVGFYSRSSNPIIANFFKRLEADLDWHPAAMKTTRNYLAAKYGWHLLIEATK